MGDVKFTNEQQKVIDARNSNLLVSAAAGSGKTAVLVERIIQLITGGNGQNPIDIDRLLVVTFTRAAAAQMKERITKAIEKKLIEEPDNKHLQRQETLIHTAQITTIDSFCQYVIRNNFNEIGLDPSYRVADEGEIKLLEESVIADFLEQKYLEADEEFLFASEYFEKTLRVGLLLQQNEDKVALQLMADVLNKALSLSIITEQDLYTLSEEKIISRFVKASFVNSFNKFVKFKLYSYF